VKQKLTVIIYFVMFAVLLWFDRFTKNLVMTNMQLGEAIPSQDAFVSIRYTINTGVSFSLFSGHPEVLIVLQSVLFAFVTIVCIATYIRLRHPVLQTGLVWVVSGGAGNLIDRISYGYVVDYISVGSFPVWNFADMCIVGGCILIGIYVLVLYEKRHKAEDKAEAELSDD
jgi:signal peptidase II